MSGRIDMAIACSPTEDSCGTLRRHIPEICIYKEWRPDIVQRLMDAQVRSWGHGKVGRKVAVILDDVFFDKRIWNDTVLRSCFMNGRHAHILLLCACQYMMDIPPAIRTQVDVCVAAKEQMVPVKSKLYEQYFGVFPSLADFTRVFDVITDDHGVLIFLNAQSSKVTDTVFWWRAPWPIPDFRVGAKWFHAVADHYVRDEEKVVPTHGVRMSE